MEYQTLFFLLAGLVLLIFGGEVLVRGATTCASSLGIPKIIIGLTVVAFGTSAPELAVSINASITGNTSIAVANVVGSNIFNILFILGLCALIKPLFIQLQIIKREVPVMIAVSVLLYIFSLSGVISKVEAAFLLLLLFIYTLWLVLGALKAKPENIKVEASTGGGYVSESQRSLLLPAAMVLFGLGIIMLGADWMVSGASAFAKKLGVSDSVIGLSIVAVGTSLPEVVTSIMATIRGERDIAVGNVIGSNLFNILGIVGLSGLFSSNELFVTDSIRVFDLPFMVGASVLCLPFFLTGKLLSRKEGLVLLGIYLAYAVYLIQSV